MILPFLAMVAGAIVFVSAAQQYDGRPLWLIMTLLVAGAVTVLAGLVCATVAYVAEQRASAARRLRDLEPRRDAGSLKGQQIAGNLHRPSDKMSDPPSR